MFEVLTLVLRRSKIPSCRKVRDKDGATRLSVIAYGFNNARIAGIFSTVFIGMNNRLPLSGMNPCF